MLSNTSVKLRLIAATVLGMLILGAAITGISAYKSYSSSLTMQMVQLGSIREVKKDNIKDYFDNLGSLITSMAASTQVMDAMSEFNDAFYKIQEETGVDPESIVPEMTDHYDKLYLDKVNYGVPNAVSRRQTLDYLPKDPNGKIAQYIYIIKNPEKIGEKNNMPTPAGFDCSYTRLHTRYHNSFNTTLNNFSLYDIFLVNMKGDLIYTDFKEKDYSTNLLTGPYADTGLGDAYKKSVGKKQGEIYLNDFMPYEPSYNLPASFISSPVFKNGEQIGVLIFQMPISKIDYVMNFGGNYEKSGLGKTGQCFLVGSDNTMRNNSRFMPEMEDALVKRLGTTIGVLKVLDKATECALEGNSGSAVTVDDKGIEKLSSYSSIDLFGLTWGIVVEIGKDEAMKSAVHLRNTLIIISVCVTVLIVVLMYLVLNSVVLDKLKKTTSLVKDLVTGDADLTHRIELAKTKARSGADELSPDEIILLTQYINMFIKNVHDIIADVKDKAHSVNTGTTDLASVTEELSANFAEQAGRITDIASAMEEMTITSEMVLSNVGESLDKTEHANTKTKEGIRSLNNVVNNINDIRTGVSSLAETIAGLSDSSTQIGDILNVINDIADQTNLLALNAAIEAARAGEAGRGFAVVADEVRKLAERTQKATTEISAIVSSLQTEAHSASEEMHTAVDTVNQGVEVIQEANQVFGQIVSAVNDISTASKSIETAVREQNSAISSVTENIGSISAGVEESNSAVASVSSSLENLSSLADDMNSTVNKFKTN
ncbi:MAG: methyl-accepting chemotaxis protein [Deferribacterales bacterium]